MSVLILPGSLPSVGCGRLIAEACSAISGDCRAVPIGDKWFHVYKVGKNRVVGWLL